MRRWLPIVLITIALLLKVALLFTSQSMADGDEAVEGIMAMDIVESGARPMYPYGIRYGAGAGVEAHLAALLFGIFGASDVALKASGLLIWALVLVLVALVGRRIGGVEVGWAAALLYGFAPQATLWSSKVAGGHNVALALCLLALLWIERGARPWRVACVLPFAALAHPIAIPLVGALAVHEGVRARGRERRSFAAALAGSAAVAALWLWPGEVDVWSPTAGHWELGALAAAVPRAVARLFAVNLSARAWPSGLELAVSLGWLFALTAAAMRATQPRRLLLYLLAPLGVIFLVAADHLVARHLLLLYPIGCLVIACGLRPDRGPRVVILAVLLLSGAALQVAELGSPNIYGPGIQSRGVDRDSARRLVREIEADGIAHVYCADPMFQWNIVFESRGDVLARWVDPLDRIPAQVEAVDRARLEGRPIALVRAIPGGAPGSPQRFEWARLEGDRALERSFPLAPGITDR